MVKVKIISPIIVNGIRREAGEEVIVNKSVIDWALRQNKAILIEELKPAKDTLNEKVAVDKLDEKVEFKPKKRKKRKSKEDK